MGDAIKKELKNALDDKFISEITDKVVRNLVKSVKKVTREEIQKGFDALFNNRKKIALFGICCVIASKIIK